VKWKFVLVIIRFDRRAYEGSGGFEMKAIQTSLKSIMTPISVGMT
jgi:hypothetical protein